MKTLAAFPITGEFKKMISALRDAEIPHDVIDPSPRYSHSGCPVIVIEQEARGALSSRSDDFICSGWVEYREPSIRVPETEPPEFTEDLFGDASIMVLAPCVADAAKIRLIAHLSGDVGPALPYLNAEMRNACYNSDGETFTYMDGPRMVTIYPRRISIAKADEIVDAWHSLEQIRCRVNDVYARRESIEPSYEMRRKPPALEIYKRLPGTSCGRCGQKTCMAFALTLWSGSAKPSMCGPIFKGDYAYLKDAFLEICAGLGIAENDFLYPEM